MKKKTNSRIIFHKDKEILILYNQTLASYICHYLRINYSIYDCW